MRDLVAFLRREEPCQRGEIVLLEKIEQHLAVGEVLNDDALVFIARASAGAAITAAATIAAAMVSRGSTDYSHSLTTNSGCIFDSRSEIVSSIYFGPIPFSNFSDAPRR